MASAPSEVIAESVAVVTAKMVVDSIMVISELNVKLLREVGKNGFSICVGRVTDTTRLLREHTTSPSV